MRTSPLRMKALLMVAGACIAAIVFAQAAIAADVYEGYSTRVGSVKRSGTNWVVYAGYSTRVGTIKGSTLALTQARAGDRKPNSFVGRRG